MPQIYKHIDIIRKLIGRTLCDGWEDTEIEAAVWINTWKKYHIDLGLDILFTLKECKRLLANKEAIIDGTTYILKQLA